MRLETLSGVVAQLSKVTVPRGLRLVLVLEDQEQLEVDYEFGCKVVQDIGHVPPASEMERVHLSHLSGYEILAESDLIEGEEDEGVSA